MGEEREPEALEATVVVVLTDEDGNQITCEIRGQVTIGERRYAVLVPEEFDPETAGLWVMGLEPSVIDGRDSLVDVEDEDEFERAANAAVALMEGRPYCRECGCTDDCACEGGCYWVEPGLCSTCAAKGKHGEVN